MSIENDLSRIADALEAIAYHLTAAPAEPSAGPVAPAAPKQTRTRRAKAAEEPTVTVTPDPTPAEPAPVAEPTIDLPTLRARFAKLAEKGKRAELIGLLESRGFKVLTDVPADQYAALSRALSQMEAL